MTKFITPGFTIWSNFRGNNGSFVTAGSSSQPMKIWISPGPRGLMTKYTI